MVRMISMPCSGKMTVSVTAQAVTLHTEDAIVVRCEESTVR